MVVDDEDADAFARRVFGHAVTLVRHILRPRPVLGTVAQRAALTLRGTPHRTREFEMLLALDLRTRARHDARVPEREVQVAQRKTDDVREAAVVRLDEPPSLTLDGIPARLVERLAGADVPLDLTQRKLPQRDARAYGEVPSRAVRGDDSDLGPHLVLAAGEGGEHSDRVRLVRRLAHSLAVELDLGVRGERHLTGSRERLRLRARRSGVMRFVDVRRRRLEWDLQQSQELDAARRRGRETEHLRRVDAHLGGLHRHPYLGSLAEVEVAHGRGRYLRDDGQRAADRDPRALAEEVHRADRAGPDVARRALRVRAMDRDGARMDHREHVPIPGVQRGQLLAAVERDDAARGSPPQQVDADEIRDEARARGEDEGTRGGPAVSAGGVGGGGARGTGVPGGRAGGGGPPPAAGPRGPTPWGAPRGRAGRRGAAGGGREVGRRGATSGPGMES